MWPSTDIEYTSGQCPLTWQDVLFVHLPCNAPCVVFPVGALQTGDRSPSAGSNKSSRGVTPRPPISTRTIGTARAARSEGTIKSCGTESRGSPRSAARITAMEYPQGTPLHWNRPQLYVLWEVDVVLYSRVRGVLARISRPRSRHKTSIFTTSMNRKVELVYIGERIKGKVIAVFGRCLSLIWYTIFEESPQS